MVSSFAPSSLSSERDLPFPLYFPVLESTKIGYVWFGRWSLLNVLSVMPSNAERLLPPQKSMIKGVKSLFTTKTKYSC